MYVMSSFFAFKFRSSMFLCCHLCTVSGSQNLLMYVISSVFLIRIQIVNVFVLSSEKTQVVCTYPVSVCLHGELLLIGRPISKTPSVHMLVSARFPLGLGQGLPRSSLY
jgi:hypothetical protein